MTSLTHLSWLSALDELADTIAETAGAFMMSHVLLDEEFARSEVDRYLGIPGQAILYKAGERV